MDIKERILIIDDTPEWLSLCAETFENAGYEVYQASCIEEAKLLPATDYALVDLFMPTNNGKAITYCRWAASERPNCQCIIISSHEEKLQETEKLNIAPVMFKGASIEEFVLIFKTKINTIDRSKYVLSLANSFEETLEKFDAIVGKMIEKSSMEHVIEYRHPANPSQTCTDFFIPRPKLSAIWATAGSIIGLVAIGSFIYAVTITELKNGQYDLRKDQTKMESRVDKIDEERQRRDKQMFDMLVEIKTTVQTKK